MPCDRVIEYYRARLGKSEELHPKTVAYSLNISLSLVYKYIKFGLIKATRRRLGSHYCSMVNRESVLDFIASRSAGQHTAVSPT